MKFKNLITTACACMILASCSTSKDIPYMIDANNLPADVLKNAATATDPVVMPGDILHINVGGLDEETVKPFNKTQYIVTGRNMTNNNNSENSMYYYLVDNNGEIDFPMLGKILVGKLTKSAIEDIIANKIYPKYLTTKPSVEVRLQNFHVYAIGEVNNPGVIKSPTGRLNILEAISMAGDLTIHGKRDNIMIIRTNADGSRQVKNVNLNDPNIIVSPDFYLQQNDCIYVEPNASRKRSSWNVPPALALTTSSIGTLISIATFVITLTKK